MKSFNIRWRTSSDKFPFPRSQKLQKILARGKTAIKEKRRFSVSFDDADIKWARSWEDEGDIGFFREFGERSGNLLKSSLLLLVLFFLPPLEISHGKSLFLFQK